MTDQVIDLTVTSFTLANHSSMADVIIELDDSLNDYESQQRPEHYEVGVMDVSSDITIISETSLEPSPVPPVCRRRSFKKTKKKMELSCQPRSAASEESIRERSPVPHLGDCPICFEKIGVNRLASTKCGHVFCEQCIIRALQVEKKCPTCRQALRGNNAYHPIFLSRG